MAVGLNLEHKSLQGQGGANTPAEEGEGGGEGKGGGQGRVGGEGDLQEGVDKWRREARFVKVVDFVITCTLFLHRYIQ